jgi:hypothetical protein
MRLLQCTLLLILLVMTTSVTAQQLNFQGVARNNTGAVLASQTIKVRLSIRDASTTGTVQYTETRSVTTSAYGSFKVLIGSAGATNVTGTIAGVTWSTGSKFLQVEIDPANGNTFTDMGTTEMVTVPTSLYATNAGTVPDNSISTAKLQNGSVTSSKLAAGVIAPSFWTLTGNNISNNNSGNVGVGITSPAARLHIADSNVVFTGPASLPTAPGNPAVSGAGTRMMWYPNKAAFRAGTVLGSGWDRDGIGNYSFAAGFNATASGRSATSFGENNKATGSYSFSAGLNCESIGNLSVSLGSNNRSSGTNAISVGDASLAEGDFSISMGASTKATGFASTSFGSLSEATNFYSTSIGYNNLASGRAALGLGYETVASGSYSTTTGYGTQSQSYGCFVAGLYNDPVITSNQTVNITTDPLFIIGNGTGSTVRRNAIVVLKNGNVGIGTSAPKEKLEIVGDAGDTTRLTLANKGGFGPAAIDFVSDYGLVNQWRPCFALSGDASPGNFVGKLEFYTNGSGFANRNQSVKGLEVRNGITYTASGTVSSFSDERLKNNIETFTDGLNVIDQIQPVSFRYNEDAPFQTNQTQVGVVAQDLEKVAPYMVHQTTHNNMNDVRYVDNQAYTFLLINSVKELKKQNEDLQKRLDKLEKKRKRK